MNGEKLEIGAKVNYSRYSPLSKTKITKHEGVITGYKNDLYVIKLKNGSYAIGSNIDTKAARK